MKANIIPYLFMLPAMALFICFVCIPSLQTVYTSLTQWEGIGARKFIGLQNYIEIFTKDSLFFRAIKNNLLWAAGSLMVPVWIGIFLANFLVRSGIKNARFFQLIFFMPQVISTVIAAVIWKWMYDPALGPVNNLLNSLKLDRLAFAWLGDPKTVMAALFIIYLWQTYGFCTMIFTSAIQGIDLQLYEASTIDGYGAVRQFTNITLPGIRQSITSTLLLVLMWSFQVLDLIMTTTGGGPGYSSYVISYYVYYQGFIVNRVGYGAAVSIVLTVIILGISRWFMHIREKE